MSEQPWMEALMRIASLPCGFRCLPRATRAPVGDTLDAGGGPGWPRAERSRVGFPDGVGLDVRLEELERPLHDWPPLSFVQPERMRDRRPAHDAIGADHRRDRRERRDVNRR